MLDALKGIGRTLITLHGESGELTLVLFADESLAIRRNGITAGVWEVGQQDDCFRELGLMAGMEQLLGVRLIAVLVERARSKTTGWTFARLPSGSHGLGSLN